MSKHLVRSLAAVAIVLLAFAGHPAAQGGKGAQDKRDDAKLREREKAKAEKEARRYEKLKSFAVNLYQTDPDFREEVDDHFDEVQREHSIKAFGNNVAPPARPTVVHDGDRLRLQTGLYDNKLVADYINHVGQRLVPPDSEKLFAFRLVAAPIPFAETLSTGTIYVSTGLVSLLDNEAQLSYVLAHEMAHVQLDQTLEVRPGWKGGSALPVLDRSPRYTQTLRHLALGHLVLVVEPRRGDDGIHAEPDEARRARPPCRLGLRGFRCPLRGHRRFLPRRLI